MTEPNHRSKRRLDAHAAEELGVDHRGRASSLAAAGKHVALSSQGDLPDRRLAALLSSSTSG